MNGAAASVEMPMAIIVIALLAVQLCTVRSLRSRPSGRVLAGGGAARSATHRIYIALEAAAKVVAVTAGILLLPG